jgi:hypothetical protein
MDTPIQDVTFGIGAGVVAISQLFGGYLIHVDNLLAPLQWLSWLSYLRYGFQAALRMELEQNTYNQHHFAQQMLSDERHQQWLQTLLVLIPQVPAPSKAPALSLVLLPTHTSSRPAEPGGQGDHRGVRLLPVRCLVQRGLPGGVFAGIPLHHVLHAGHHARLLQAAQRHRQDQTPHVRLHARMLPGVLQPHAATHLSGHATAAAGRVHIRHRGRNASRSPTSRPPHHHRRLVERASLSTVLAPLGLIRAPFS